jgi:hypothetical protein
MRAAGFARVDGGQLADLGVQADEQDAIAYTRNGLVACRRSECWCMYVQVTGQLPVTSAGADPCRLPVSLERRADHILAAGWNDRCRAAEQPGGDRARSSGGRDCRLPCDASASHTVDPMN